MPRNGGIPPGACGFRQLFVGATLGQRWRQRRRTGRGWRAGMGARQRAGRFRTGPGPWSRKRNGPCISSWSRSLVVVRGRAAWRTAECVCHGLNLVFSTSGWSPACWCSTTPPGSAARADRTNHPDRLFSLLRITAQRLRFCNRAPGAGSTENAGRLPAAT